MLRTLLLLLGALVFSLHAAILKGYGNVGDSDVFFGPSLRKAVSNLSQVHFYSFGNDTVFCLGTLVAGTPPGKVELAIIKYPMPNGKPKVMVISDLEVFGNGPYPQSFITITSAAGNVFVFLYKTYEVVPPLVHDERTYLAAIRDVGATDGLVLNQLVGHTSVNETPIRGCSFSFSPAFSDTCAPGWIEGVWGYVADVNSDGLEDLGIIQRRSNACQVSDTSCGQDLVKVEKLQLKLYINDLDTPFRNVLKCDRANLINSHVTGILMNATVLTILDE